MNENAEVLKKVEALLKGNESIEVDMNDPAISGLVVTLRRAFVRNDLAKNGIAVDFPAQGSLMRVYKFGSPSGIKPTKVPVAKVGNPDDDTKPKKSPAIKRSQHSYVPPKIADDLISVLTDEASHVVWLTGPTQCGKTTLVRYVSGKMGRKMYQINCRGDMGSEAFFGEKTVTIDAATKQNIIVHQKGIIEQAMIEGLDAQGNEVGAPAILFIDEAAAMPAHVAHGINRLLESDDPRRTIVIAEDGGRLVRSHSGFRIVLAANTVGRGATSTESVAYTAQMDALDISLLNRVAVTFRMGYDREVERHIVLEKIGNDKVVSQVLKFRDAIRGHIKSGKLVSPFSTKRMVDIANMYRVFGNIAKAVYYTVFEYLLPEERSIYNEQAVAIFGEDLLAKFVENDVDYI